MSSSMASWDASAWSMLRRASASAERFHLPSVLVSVTGMTSVEEIPFILRLGEASTERLGFWGMGGAVGLRGMGGADVFLLAALGGTGGLEDGGLSPDASRETLLEACAGAFTSTVRADGRTLLASARRRAMIASASAPRFHFPPLPSSASPEVLRTWPGLGGRLGGVGLLLAVSFSALIVVEREMWLPRSGIVRRFGLFMSSFESAGLRGGVG
mmetsp:Transcript_19493/g.74803  ORF Transcript_19493/g.74803 Transcript_19493/m.74803 type:complete len:214 (-) Transcript_19493:559-1200(-)